MNKELVTRIEYCLKYQELPTVARQTFDLCKAALSEPVASQDVEAWIAAKKYYTIIANPEEMDSKESVSVAELREFLGAWMAGHARVPVDVLETILEVVRGKLNEAYQNAMPVCCGQPGQECCGNPVAEWKPSDIELMDSLGPVEKTISAMLTASKDVDNE